MDVHVGSFFDPEEVPGLAHFLGNITIVENCYESLFQCNAI